MDCFNFEDTQCGLHIQLWPVFASECHPKCHRFSVPGQIPGVWPEWYLPGCWRVWHPCLHLQAVVWGSELHRWWRHKRTIYYPHVYPVCRLHCFVYFCLFVSNLFFSLLKCRPYRTGDGSGLWRQRSVLGLSGNGQKSQILQFVEGFKFKEKKGRTAERWIELSLCLSSHYHGHQPGIYLWFLEKGKKEKKRKKLN